jgi:hypothetical protein
MLCAPNGSVLRQPARCAFWRERRRTSKFIPKCFCWGLPHTILPKYTKPLPAMLKVLKLIEIKYHALRDTFSGLRLRFNYLDKPSLLSVVCTFFSVPFFHQRGEIPLFRVVYVPMFYIGMAGERLVMLQLLSQQYKFSCF